MWTISLVRVFPLVLLCLGASAAAAAAVIPDGYTLVPSKEKAVTSLSELKDGVYFVELFSPRAECGGSAAQGTCTCTCIIYIHGVVYHPAW